MNHLEAQSYIMPFIEGRLPDQKQLEFVMHMKTCKSCHEELEIYFTLVNGMQETNPTEELTGNFPKDLERKLNRIEHKARGRRRVRFSTFSIATIIIMLFMILFYGQCLNRVYTYEQDTKASMQGQYYFVRAIGDILFIAEDRAREVEEQEADEERKNEVTIYKKIDAYRILEKDAGNLWKMGDAVYEKNHNRREE